MKHIQTLNTRDMAKSAQNGGCGECQTSCQSACKQGRQVIYTKLTGNIRGVGRSA